jgi:hypothetical protein
MSALPPPDMQVDCFDSESSELLHRDWEYSWGCHARYFLLSWLGAVAQILWFGALLSRFLQMSKGVSELNSKRLRHSTLESR